jgi:hypothetical protein
MPSGLDIITDSLEKIGVYAPGETIPDADAARGLIILNDLLDMWSNDSTAVYCNTTQNFTMIAGQTSYTIGTTGSPDINAPRPLAILDDPGTVGVIDGSGFNYPVRVIQQEEWNQIAAKNIEFVQSTIPLVIFYDPQYPLGVINIYPAPAAGYQMYFIYRYILTDLTLTGQVSLPQGYMRAIKDNLAELMWPYWYTLRTDPLPPNIIRDAKRSLDAIKRQNRKQIIAGIDSILNRGNSSTYNIFTDTYSNQG